MNQLKTKARAQVDARTKPKAQTRARALPVAPRDHNSLQAVTELLRDLNDQVPRTDTAHDKVFGNSDVLVAQSTHEFQASGFDMRGYNLSIRLRRISMLQDRRFAKRAQSLGITLNDALLLHALRRVGPEYCLRPMDILKMHSITSGTVTYRIDQLTQQGFAERIPDPNDGRGFLIRLTDRGKAVSDRLILESSTFWAKASDSILRIPGAFDICVEVLRFIEQTIENDLSEDT